MSGRRGANKTNAGRSMKNTPNPNNKSKARNKPRKTRYCPKEIVKDCTRNYLRVQTDPWSHFNSGKEVCIPDTLSKPSWKVQTFFRGTFSATSNGVAALAVNPWVAMFNNQNCVARSSGASTGSIIKNLASVLSANTRAPFTSSSDVESRVVGCGIRVKYIGKYLDTSGIIGVGIRNDSDDDLGLLTTSEFLSRPNTCRSAVTHGGRWIQVAFRPSSSWDLDPKRMVGNVNESGVQTVLAVVVEGAQANAPFEYEVCFFHEYLATDASGIPGTTLSHTDINGFGAIRSYINKVWNHPITTDLYNKGLDYVYNYLTKDILALTGQSPLLLM